MKRFKNILIVCDGSRAEARALERGQWLATANAARVTLIGLTETRPGDLARLVSFLPGTAKAADIDAQVGAYHEDRLETLATPLREAGLTVTVALGRGTGFIEVIRRVLAFDHDIVIKGAEVDGAIPRFGGLDMHLLRKCPCPVWVLKEDGPRETRQILVAVDPDPDDPVRDGLNRTVLELATSLAERDDAEVEVVNVWRLQEEAALRHSLVKIPSEEVEKIVAAEERQSRWRFDTLMADFGAFEHRMCVRHIKGQAEEVIPALAEADGFDTIVMGTIARTGIKGFFIGNTAETILGHVACSVLTAKPRGFVSPVELEP